MLEECRRARTRKTSAGIVASIGLIFASSGCAGTSDIPKVAEATLRVAEAPSPRAEAGHGGEPQHLAQGTATVDEVLAFNKVQVTLPQGASPVIRLRSILAPEEFPTGAASKCAAEFQLARQLAGEKVAFRQVEIEMSHQQGEAVATDFNFADTSLVSLLIDNGMAALSNDAAALLRPQKYRELSVRQEFAKQHQIGIWGGCLKGLIPEG